MPVTVFPSFRVARLSAVQPGSLIRMRDKTALVLRGSQSDPSEKPLAVLTDRSSFEYYIHRDDTQVLDFGDDLVLDVDARTNERMPPDEASGCTLFLFEDGLRCVARVRGGFNDWALANIETGAIGGPEVAIRWAFPRWRLGVKRADNKHLWLIDQTGK